MAVTFSSPVNFRPMVQAFSNHNFAVFTAGNVASLVGTWMQRVAVGWLAWEMTQSAGWLGLIAFADLFPAVLLGPIAGAVADRWDRLKVIRLGEFLSFVQAVVLFVLVATGLITIELLLGLTVFLGAASALNQPARLATIPMLVRSTDVPAAVAINSMVFNVARFIGPAVGGLLIVMFDVAVVFAMNALSFLIFLLALSRIRLQPLEKMAATRPGLIRELLDGMRYTAAHSGIGPVFILMIATSLCSRPVVELLPGFTGQVFGLGAGGLAIFTSAVGAGAVFAGLWLSGHATAAADILTVILRTTVLLAGSLMIFSLTVWPWLAVVSLVVTGFCLSVAGITLQTLIYFSVQPSMRGRVLSLYGTVFRGGPAVGALVMGFVAEGLGMRWPLFVASLIVVGVWLAIRRRRAQILQGLAADTRADLCGRE